MGNATSAPAARRAARLRSAALLLAWGVGLALFAWYAQARLLGQPAISTRGGTAATGGTAGNVARGLVDALESPALSGLQGGARVGSLWVNGAIQLGAADGAWNPARSPEQRRLIAYLAGADAAGALDEVVVQARILAESLASSPGRDLVMVELGLRPGLAASAARLLAERARYRIEQQDDVAAAVDDLQAALRLAGALEAQLKYYGPSFLELPMYELNCRTTETHLPPELAQRLIATLRDELGLRVADGFRVTGSVGAIEATLDHFFTDDGHGDGWMVLSAAPVGSIPFGAVVPPHPAWNLLSPLYRSRAEMRVRLQATAEIYSRLDSLSYPQMQQVFLAQSDPQPRDGTLMEALGEADEFDFARGVEMVIRRRAAVVLLALSAYRARHGEYPASLDMLVPELLPALPLDAYTAGPFVYEARGDSFALGPARPLTPRITPYGWSLVRQGYRSDSYIQLRAKAP